MRFEVHQAQAISEDNFVLLAQALSTAIVDLFRMLYVMASEEAKAANMGRFGYFLEMADEHTKALNSNLANLANRITASELNVITQIERDCLSVLGLIKRRNDINFDVDRCFFVMSKAVNDAYGLFARTISEELSRVESQVLHAFGQSAPHTRPGSIENLRLRFSIQSAILKDIKTIAHDSRQSYALHYFLIDRRLLYGSFPGP